MNRSKSKFKDYILPKIKTEREIELFLYSNQDNFVFKIDLSYFSDLKVTIKTVSESKKVKIQMKEQTHLFFKTIEINPNFEVILPDLIPHESTKELFNTSKSLSTSASFEKNVKSQFSSNKPDSQFFNAQDNDYSSTKIQMMSDSNETPVPISVPIKWMTYTEDGVECTTDKECLAEIDYTGTCGERCWTSGNNDQTFEYTFKGERFAIYGSKNPKYGEFELYLNNELITTINETDTSTQSYVLLYLSDVLEYNQYIIKTKGIGNIYEIYKFAFWPSIKARRINASEMESTQTWIKESDFIGGIGEWTNNSGATKSILFQGSKVWVYGTEALNHSLMNIQFNDQSIDVDTKNSQRVDGKMLWESEIQPFNTYKITVASKTSSVYLLCVYYLYDPQPEISLPNPSMTPIPDTNMTYINKVFEDYDIPDQIGVTTDSNIKQISGCTFKNITMFKPPRNNFIRFDTEIPIFQNTFEYYNVGHEYNHPMPFWANYDGKFTVSYCKFINCMHRSDDTYTYDGNVLNSRNKINAIFESCDFLNCGNIKDRPIFGIFGDESRLSLSYCNFIFTFGNNIESSRILLMESQDVSIDNCHFVNTGEIKIVNSGQQGSFIFTNNAVRYNHQSLINAKSMGSKPTIKNNVFENCDLDDSTYFISYEHFVNEIELINNTFSSIKVSSGIQYGGSIAVWFKNHLYSVTNLTYTDCHFINNENAHDKDIINNGGAIQYGYSSSIAQTRIVFENCEFRGNQCLGKGGALSISINQSLTITNCTFEDNAASKGSTIYIYGQIVKEDDNEPDIAESKMESISIIDCQFIGNKGNGDVTGILNEEGNIKFQNIYISSCTFYNNGENNDQMLIQLFSINTIFENNIVKYSNSTQSSGIIKLNALEHFELSKCTFTNCCYSGDSNIQIQNTPTNTLSATITDCIFNDCLSSKYIISIQNIELISISDCTFNFSTNDNACSGISIDSPNSISINNCQFEKCFNHNADGACLYIHRERINGNIDSIELQNIFFDNCIGSTYNTIFVDCDCTYLSTIHNLTIQNSQNDQADSYIYGINVNQDILFEGCIFSNCRTNNEYGGGSGSRLIPLNKVTFNECTWKNNYCTRNGGAFQYGAELATNNKIIEFQGCNFTINRTPESGGAISIQTHNNINIKDCHFNKNTAGERSTQIHNLQSDEQNQGYGGSVYINPQITTDISAAPVCTITGTDFVENQANDGHAIFIVDSQSTTLSIHDNVFTDNGQTGSTIVTDQIIDIDDSTFSLTQAYNKRSNLVRYAKTPAIYEHMHFYQQIEIFEEQNEARFYNCTFYDCEFNQSETSGHQYVITLHCNQFTFENSTIEFKDSEQACGGICIDCYCNITIINSYFCRCNVKEMDQSAGIYYKPTTGNDSDEKFKMNFNTFSEMAGVDFRCFYITTSINNADFSNNIIQDSPEGGRTGYFCYYNSDICEFNGWQFLRNKAKQLNGGGSGLFIFPKDFTDNTKIIFSNCIWQNNEAIHDPDLVTTNNNGDEREFLYNGLGGAIQFGFDEKVSQIKLEFNECEFKNNSAAFEGGALAIQTTKDCTIQNCTFESNKAGTATISLTGGKTKSGGAIFIDPDFINDLVEEQRNPQINIISCEFKDNEAKGDGSAIFLRGQEAKFNVGDVTFSNNQGGNSVFYSSCLNLNLSNSQFTSTDSINARAIELGDGSIYDLESITIVGFILGGIKMSTQTSSNTEFETLFDKCVFTGNSAATNGGALSISSNKPVTINNCVFNNNRALGQIDGESLTGYGGAIYLESNEIKSCIIGNCTFENNFDKSGDGCAIYILFDQNIESTNSVEILPSCVFHDNYNPNTKVALHNYAIYTSSPVFSIHESTISANTTQNQVSGIKFVGSNSVNKVFNVTFEKCQNYADKNKDERALAIDIHHTAKQVTIEFCRFNLCGRLRDTYENYFRYTIYDEGKDTTIHNCTFEGGQDTMNAPAIKIRSYGTHIITNCYIINPKSNNRGAISYLSEGYDGTLESIEPIKGEEENENFVFHNNTIENAQGSDRIAFDFVVKKDNVVDVNNITIKNCKESKSLLIGITVYEVSVFKFEKFTFKNNLVHASYGGGTGIWYETRNRDKKYDFCFTECLFIGNHAERNDEPNHQGYGGALQLGNTPESSTFFYTVTNCTFESNTADRYGGGLSIEAENSFICENCQFLYNKAAEFGGAIYVDPSCSRGSSEITITKCSFEDNDSSGSAIYCKESGNSNSRMYITGSCQFKMKNKSGSTLIIARCNSLTISDITFDMENLDNTCRAIKIENPATDQHIDNVVFKNCATSDFEGNAIYIESLPIQQSYRPTNIIIENCIFENCGTIGWAVYSLDQQLAYQKNTITYTSNDRGKGGGGLYTVGGRIEENIFENTFKYIDGKGNALTIKYDGINSYLSPFFFNHNTFIKCNGEDVRCFDIYLSRLDGECSEIMNITVRDCPEASALTGTIEIVNPYCGEIVFKECKWINNTVLGSVGGGCGLSMKTPNSFDIYFESNCLFENNTADDGKGGALQIGCDDDPSQYSVYIRSCAFRSNKALYGGAIAIETTNKWIIEKQCTFENNKAYVRGGAIYVNTNLAAEDAYFTGIGSVIRNCSFINNESPAREGTILYFTPTKPGGPCSEITVDRNIMNGRNGYLISSAYENLVINNLDISGELIETQKFSFLYEFSNGKTTLNNCQFTKIGCELSVILIDGLCILEMNSCNFVDCVRDCQRQNKFIIYGSYEYGITFIATKCVFKFTSTSLYSTAICIDRFAFFTLNDCNFTNCWSNNNNQNQIFPYPGAIRYGPNPDRQYEYKDKTDLCCLTIRGCTFDNCNHINCTDSSGRVIIGYGANRPILENNTIKNTVDGGYIFSWEYLIDNAIAITLNEFRFENNKASCSDGGGSGISIKKSNTIEFANCYFIKNELTNKESSIGGGGFSCGDFSSELLNHEIQIIKCYFEDNSVPNGANGGSLYIRSPKHHTTISECRFSDTRDINSQGIARIGGAIFITEDQGGVSIEGCNFSHTHSTLDGNAICIDHDTNFVTIKDCIFTDCHHNQHFTVIFSYGNNLSYIHNVIEFTNISKTSRGLVVYKPSLVEIRDSNFYNCLFNEHGCGFAFNTRSLTDTNSLECVIIENTIFDKCYSSTSINVKQSAIYLCVNHAIIFERVTIQNSNPTSNCNIIIFETPNDNVFIEEQTIKECKFINCSTEYEQNHRGGIGFKYDTIHNIVFLICYFNNLRTTGFGGALALNDPDSNPDDFSIEFQFCKFFNNSVTGNGVKGSSLYINVSFDVTIKNCNFTYQSLDGYGGSIYVERSSLFFIENNGFYSTETSEGNGNAIYLSRGLPLATILNNNRFVDCGTSSIGSVIESEAKEFIFIDNIIRFTKQNQGTRGILFPCQCTVNISDSTISGCNSIEEGGGILYRGDPSNQPEFIHIEKTVFEDNIASNGCALLLNIRSLPNIASLLVEIKNCSFQNNNVNSNEGSVLHLNISSDVNIYDCDFTDCGISEKGSVIFLNGEKVSISNITIKFTQENKSSCGIEINSFSEIEFTNNSFICCHSNSFGGGIRININSKENNSTIHTFENLSFERCYAKRGSAIYLNETSINDNIEIINCTFNKNKASQHGGAIFIENIKSITINDCLFKENNANYYYLSSTEAELLYEKLEGRGGAIFIIPSFLNSNENNETDEVVIENCTFLSNSAYDGYGIYIEGYEGGESIIIKDNIFKDNHKSDNDKANDIYSIYRSVISSEIVNLYSGKIITENSFNNDNSNGSIELMYVDHYGNPILPTRTQSNIFTISNFFTKSDTFYEITPTQSSSFAAHQKITISNSASLTFVIRKSISYSASYFASNTISISYNEQDKTYVIINTKTNYMSFFPYIIHYLSPSYVPTFITLMVQRRDSITKEQLIGVTCGGASIFFLVLGIIILVIKRRNENKQIFDEFDDISDSLEDIKEETEYVDNYY